MSAPSYQAGPRPGNPPTGSAQPTDPVGRRTVSGRLLAEVLVAAHLAPGRNVQPGGRVVGDHNNRTADRYRADPPAQLDHRQRATHAPTVQHRIRRSDAGRRSPRAAPRGSGPRPARCCPGATTPARCRARALPSPPTRATAAAWRRCTRSRWTPRTRVGHIARGRRIETRLFTRQLATADQSGGGLEEDRSKRRIGRGHHLLDHVKTEQFGRRSGLAERPQE